MSLIPALMNNDALKQDIENTNPQSGVAIWWFGQSGFLVKSATASLLFDPYLSDSLTRKYASTDKPHTRMTELAIAPDQLTGIDVITSTHNHTDHLDRETLGPLFAANPTAKFLIPEANRDFVVDRLGCDSNWPVGLVGGDSARIGPIEIHAIPAAHNAVDRDDQGRCRYLGYVVKLAGTSIYHSGDTMMYDGMAEGLKALDIDVAILPINGYKPERRVSGNLFGDEAAMLAHDIGAEIVIPCHFDMFTFNTESPDLFVQTCERLKQRHKVLRCGERFLVQGSSHDRT